MRGENVHSSRLARGHPRYKWAKKRIYIICDLLVEENMNEKITNPHTYLYGVLAYGFLGGVLLLSGCSTTEGTSDATADLTEAPFKATTDISSSTTPGTAAIDRLTRAREKAELFVGYSYEHLRTEAARGSGEHVASLAVLAGIPAEHQAQFQQNLRENYSTLFQESFPSRKARVRLVNIAWAEGFGRLESETMKHQETGIANRDLQLGPARNSRAIMSQR